MLKELMLTMKTPDIVHNVIKKTLDSMDLNEDQYEEAYEDALYRMKKWFSFGECVTLKFKFDSCDSNSDRAFVVPKQDLE